MYSLLQQLVVVSIYCTRFSSIGTKNRLYCKIITGGRKFFPRMFTKIQQKKFKISFPAQQYFLILTTDEYTDSLGILLELHLNLVSLSGNWCHKILDIDFRSEVDRYWISNWYPGAFLSLLAMLHAFSRQLESYEVNI